MLLAVDVGNSAIKFGLFDGATLSSKFSIPTIRDASADEIKLAVGDKLPTSVDSAIVCSVVPDVEDELRLFLRAATDAEPILVTNSFDFGLKINYEPLESLGTDRLVNAFAAVEKYGAPVIVCSFGTATTIDVVSADREFIGGIIAPGMDAMAEALHLRAPRLPEIDVSQPGNLIGNSTATSIQSGVYNGYVAMVEGLLEKIQSETGSERIVVTGGNATEVTVSGGVEVIVDPNLILYGLRLLFEEVPPA